MKKKLLLSDKIRAELFDFFYYCHYKLWDMVIKTGRFKKNCIGKLFPGLILKGDCFGCELADNCCNCFLFGGTDNMCGERYSYYENYKGALWRSLREISYAKKIRDCGYHIVKHPEVDQLLIKLFNMMQEL